MKLVFNYFVLALTSSDGLALFASECVDDPFNVTLVCRLRFEAYLNLMVLSFPV